MEWPHQVSDASLELLIGVGICLALALPGVALLRLLLPRVDTLDILAFAFPLGAGVVTWCLFLASWAGEALTPLAAVLVWAGLLALALAISRIPGLGPRDARGADRVERTASELPSRHFVVLLLALGGLTCLAAWLGVNASYYAWDDMAIWAVKGYGIAEEGSIWAAGTWGDHGLTYPLNIPILIGLFRFAGDALPASKLAFPLFYLSLTIGCLRFWLQRGVQARLAALGMLCLALTPLVFEHATLGYANLPYTAYLVLGCGEAVQGMITRDARRQVLSGLLLGLAAWTRPEGWLAITSVMIAMGFVACVMRPRGLRPLAWIVPAAVLAGCWAIFVRMHAPGGQISEAVRAAATGWPQGSFHLGALLYIGRFVARQAVEVTVWGILPVACAALFLLRSCNLRSQLGADVLLLGSALLVLAAGITLQFYLADYIGQLVNYLGNSANRMSMPVALVAVLLAVLLAREPVPGMGAFPELGEREGRDAKGSHC